MMTYEEFKDEIKDELKEYLPEKYQDADIVMSPVIKNNDTVLDAISIREPEINIAPSIYINQFYEDYQNGRSMDSILSAIVKINEEHSVSENFDLSNVMDIDQVKDKIVAKLVNEEMNQQLLSGKPYGNIEDLAVIYQIRLSAEKGGVASITVNDQMLDSWGVTQEELHDIAMNNINIDRDVSIKSMHEQMMEIMLPDIMMQNDMTEDEAKIMIGTMMPEENGNFYVISNREKVNGAAVILNDEVREKIAEEIGGDYFILPSSIHELLALRKEDGMDYHELEGMVRDINQNEVSPEERLSDHVYEYDAKAHELYRSDKSEERKMEKQVEKKPEKPEKKSLKERLAQKKEKVNAKNTERAKTKQRGAEL